MSVDTIQLGNQGIKIVIHVKKPDGTPRDLTDASALKIKIKPALSFQGKSYDAVIEGGPTDGAVSCVVGAGDIDTLATWKGQAYYEIGTIKVHTHPEEIFFVEGNLA